MKVSKQEIEMIPVLTFVKKEGGMLFFDSGKSTFLIPECQFQELKMHFKFINLPKELVSEDDECQLKINI